MTSNAAVVARAAGVSDGDAFLYKVQHYRKKQHNTHSAQVEGSLHLQVVVVVVVSWKQHYLRSYHDKRPRKLSTVLL